MRLPAAQPINHLGQPALGIPCMNRVEQALQQRRDCRGVAGTLLEAAVPLNQLCAEPRYIAPVALHCWLIDKQQSIVETSLHMFTQPNEGYAWPTSNAADRRWVMLWETKQQQRFLDMLSKGWPIRYTGRQPDYVYLPGLILDSADNEHGITQDYIAGWRAMAGYAHSAGGLDHYQWQQMLKAAPGVIGRDEMLARAIAETQRQG